VESPRVWPRLVGPVHQSPNGGASESQPRWEIVTSFHRLSMLDMILSEHVAVEGNSANFLGAVEPWLTLPIRSSSHFFMAADTVGLRIIKCQII